MEWLAENQRTYSMQLQLFSQPALAPIQLLYKIARDSDFPVSANKNREVLHSIPQK